MQCTRRTHGENDLAVLSNAESELPSQLDTYALQQAPEAVPQRNRPEEPLITPDSEEPWPVPLLAANTGYPNAITVWV